jgi:hypothetical protein
MMDRRTMLRGMLGGAACAVGLPLLDAMRSNHGNALADGLPLPKRFGVFFWANGLPWHGAHGHPDKPDLWTPSAMGAGYNPSPLLEPLRGIHDRVSVITGLEPHTEVPPSPDGQGDGHMRGAAVALSSDRCRSEGFNHPSHVFAFNRATLDHVVATTPTFVAPAGAGTAPRFRSIQLGVSRALFHNYGHWMAISHAGPDKLNIPITSSVDLWNTLFGVPTDTAILERRASLLDAVSEDAKRVKARLGVKDRERVDAHLEHLGELQKRLRATTAACKTPAKPGGRSEDLKAELETQTRLLAFALQCDLTRVFSMMFTSPASNHVFSNLGVGAGMHQVCHDGNYEAVKAITVYQMQALRIFLDVLASTPDVDGMSLLDTSVVLGTSEYGEGFKHNPKEHPVLLCGRARGTLKSGQHVRLPGGNLSRVHLTILRALGINAPTYGFSGAQTSDPLPGLLA